MDMIPLMFWDTLQSYCKTFFDNIFHDAMATCVPRDLFLLNEISLTTGIEISNWMHLSISQVDCKNHLSKCTIHLSEIYKANVTYVKIRNTQSSVGQVLQVFHLSDCHFYSSQTIRRVKLRTLKQILY